MPPYEQTSDTLKNEVHFLRLYLSCPVSFCRKNNVGLAIWQLAVPFATGRAPCGDQQGAVALTIGSAPRRTVSELRQFDRLFILIVQMT